MTENDTNQKALLTERPFIITSLPFLGKSFTFVQELAEARGFEPPRHFCPHDFESCAFNHSATLPPPIISHLYIFPNTPLYFVRSGRIHVSQSVISAFGYNAFDRSSTVFSNHEVYVLNVGGNYVMPVASPTASFYALPLRELKLVELLQKNKVQIVSTSVKSASILID